MLILPPRALLKNATYSAPPSHGRHGRTALHELFGRATGREFRMQMSWHNLIFDPIQQIGVGEYAFKYREQTHGVRNCQAFERSYS